MYMDILHISEIVQEIKYCFPLTINKNDLFNFKFTFKISIFAQWETEGNFNYLITGILGKKVFLGK